MIPRRQSITQRPLRPWTTTALALSLSLAPAWAQDVESPAETAAEETMTAWDFIAAQLNPVQGPARAAIGELATIEVPEGYFAIDGDNTRVLMQAFGNLVDGTEQATFGPQHMDWFVVFEFDDCGFIKDDEKDALDADAMLKSMKAGNVEANKIRKQQGLETMELEGWAMPPRYNEASRNLEWALRLRNENGSITVNQNTRLLGRHGVMRVTLVCDPEQLDVIQSEYQRHLSNFQYTQGNTYAEYRQGDKLAKMGLSALVVGGGLAVAAKSGLLQKLIKPLLIGLAALGAGISKLFGRKKG